MSFSDQQGCPQIFNIRPIDLHYVFSVFPSQNLPKAAENALSRQAILHAANDLPMPMPIHHPAFWKMGKISYRNGGRRGIRNSPGAPARSQESPKKERFFLLCLPTIQQVAGVTDGIFLMAFVPSSFWQNINIGDSWHQLKLVSQNSAWKKWVWQQGLWPTYIQDVLLGCQWKWS